MKHSPKSMTKKLNRRALLKGGALGIGGVAALACSKKSEEPAAATSAPATAASASKPETPDLRFGMIALTDCSPIVIAHEKGLFQEIRHQLHRHQRRQLGGHPRLAFERRHPSHAHAHRHAASLRPWVCRVRPRSR